LFLDAAGVVLKLTIDTKVTVLDPIPETYRQAIDRIGKVLCERY
jgi:hypothetical protein